MILSIQKLMTRLTSFVWDEDMRNLTGWRRAVVFVLRVLYMLLKELMGGQLNLRAMSLVYTTLLSIVPLRMFIIRTRSRACSRLEKDYAGVINRSAYSVPLPNFFAPVISIILCKTGFQHLMVWSTNWSKGRRSLMSAVGMDYRQS